MRGQDLGVEGPGHELVFAESGRSQVMARSRTRKLIVAGPRHENLFFNLEDDPLELNNLYRAAEDRDEAKRMEAALAAWRPEGLKPPHLDESAPQIDQPNVPPRDLSHRAQIIAYYREKMTSFE